VSAHATIARGSTSPDARGVIERSRQFLRRNWLTGAAILLATVFSWPYTSLTPGIGGDANWMALGAIAAHERLPFGDQLVWTYGPLGFLTQGPLLYFGVVAGVTFLFQLVVQVLLAGTVYLAARRSFPAVVAFVLAVVVVPFVADRAVAVVFAWSALTICATRRTSLVAVFPVAAGALAGFLVLGKLNHGVEAVLLATIALAAMPGRQRRDAALFAVAMLVSAGTGWLATGQSLGDVWPYLRYGVDVVTGYPAAMGNSNPAASWQLWAAALVVALAAVVVWNTRARSRAALIAACAIYLYLTFKAAFVRHDGAHAVLFFGDAALLFAVLPVRRPQRGIALTGIATSIVLFAAAFGSLRIGGAIDPREHTRNVVEMARTLASKERRDNVQAAFVAQVKATMPVPQAALDLVGDRTVSGWPDSNGSSVYAYRLDWRPIVTPEPYLLFTSSLDELAARQLRSERAPERILRQQLPTADNRFPAHLAPATAVAMLCRYEELGREEAWQVLGIGDERCGAPRRLSAVEAGWGEPVAVPQASRDDALVVVRIEGTEPNGLERLTGLWLRPRLRMLTLDGTGFRLVPATAGDGLLLRAPSRADYRPPFNFAPNANEVSVLRDGGDSGTVRFVFEEVPIRPLPGRASSARGGR